ncbi:MULTISPECIES: pirin family protein [Empedobacter]|uniref:Pirin family protein n=1 Tax=Empedobacter falsenii TaxID=343874 RepID=A0A427BHJ4_9FLAO|nr:MULTISPECIES: pirin family protein [Empedobacter]MBY0065873.1 pirin family protein [Empedobacter falsenii]RRT87880.1 pirin family protein [Empedobacter falsenii]RRT88660.1 pirin family protein [Empedobacter falsenii]
MNTKNIEIVIAPREPHFVGDGFRVHNFIPSGYHLDMKRMDPFIMLDYNSKFNFPATDKPKGVGVHPHRGFETVTIAYQGSVSHHDSAGGGGTIHQGDVQWMTAASGVLHKEYHAEEFYKQGGIFQMVQLWVNLPAKDKMSTPKYQAISHKDIPTVDVENGFVEVIAGEYNQAKGAASTFSPVNMLNAKLNEGGKANFSFPANYNTVLLVIEGEVKVNEQEIVPTDHLLLFTNEGEDFTIEATENSIVLILSGEPLNEPIASYGPFVMNTQDQIREAFDDYNNGKFGTLEN